MDSIRVRSELLPDGISLWQPVRDEKDRVLLKAGIPVTAELKQSLIAQGIEWVMLHPDDALQVMGVGEDAATNKIQSSSPAKPRKRTPQRVLPPEDKIIARTESLAKTVSLSVDNPGQPLHESVDSKGTTPYDKRQHQRLSEQFSTAKGLLDSLIDEVLAGTARDSQALDSVAAGYVQELTDDTDLVIYSSAELAPSPKLTERAIRTSILAMAVAIEMDYGEEHVREVGLCGLIQDWGMFYLPERMQDFQVPISEADREAFQRHPLYTAELLSTVDGISREVRLAATQVRENANGSGYPRGLTDDQIHPYARILHVVDVYLSLSTEMRGRQPYVPYDVMVYMLHQIKAGRITEKAMRALLNVVSLFPIGSHVRLTDGTEARVIRRNDWHYTAPIVQRVTQERQIRFDAPEGLIINLAKSNNRVMIALPSPDKEELRIGEKLMNEILWDNAIG
jgi:HD-GYP domain-containing protein (c-di-GMP phosphodiesterase class II)